MNIIKLLNNNTLDARRKIKTFGFLFAASSLMCVFSFLIDFFLAYFFSLNNFPSYLIFISVLLITTALTLNTITKIVNEFYPVKLKIIPDFVNLSEKVEKVEFMFLNGTHKKDL